MKPVAFKIEGTACSGCGGTHAIACVNDFGLCERCWTSVALSKGMEFYSTFRSLNRDFPLSDTDVTLWIADKLEKDIGRLIKNGIVGRCEAISRWGYASSGTQCANAAHMRRDGHVVCERHARSRKIQFVGETADPYVRLAGLIRNLSKKDQRFAKMIFDVGQSLQGGG